MFRALLWAAILPSGILCKRILNLDKVESEPAGLLWKVFLLGCLSCVPASILEAAGESIIPEDLSPTAYSVAMFFVMVPLVEEGCKFFALNTVSNEPVFNYTFDGIVYGVMASLGFATVENILYVFVSGSFGVAFTRAILSVPLHCVCGVFMGYYYGLAHRNGKLGHEETKVLYLLLSLLVPMLIHGIYDVCLSLDDPIVTLGGLIFTLVMFVLAVQRTRISAAQDEAFWGGSEQ